MTSGEHTSALLAEADKWIEDSGHWTKSDPHRCASHLILDLATALRAAALASGASTGAPRSAIARLSAQWRSRAGLPSQAGWADSAKQCADDLEADAALRACAEAPKEGEVDGD